MNHRTAYFDEWLMLLAHFSREQEKCPILPLVPRFPALRWLPLVRGACRGGRTVSTRRRGEKRAPMTASGMLSSPPRGAIAAPATAFPSPSRAAGCHPQAAAGSPARSTAGSGGGQRFGRRLQGERRRPARRQPAARVHGAASSQATVAAAPGRRRGASHPDETSSGLRQLQRRPARSPDGPFSVSKNHRAHNQRGASTITTWRPSNLASCSTLANSATSAFTLSSSLVPISWCAISRPR